MGYTTFNTKFYLDKLTGHVGRACSHCHNLPGCYPERYVFLARRHENIQHVVHYYAKKRKYIVVLLGRVDRLYTIKLTRKEAKEKQKMIDNPDLVESNITKSYYHYIDIITGSVFPVWDKKLVKELCNHPLVNIGKFRYKHNREWDVRFEGRTIKFRADGEEHEKILTDEQNAMRIAHILTQPPQHFKQAI